MDLRQILDVGASPQAPPGRKPEPPPNVGEFEKTLKMARKEETPGEVAEKEPNAQLQTLDSEKKETGTKDPVDSAQSVPAISLPLDPASLPQQSNFVAISQWLNNGGAMKGFTIDAATQPVPVKVVPFNQANACVIDPLSMPTANLTATKTSAEQTTPDYAELNLDATKNEALTTLVASAFEGKLAPKTDGKSAPVQMGLREITVDQRPLITQLIPEETKAALNVTRVQSTATPVVDQTTQTKLTENQIAVNPQPLTSDVKVKADNSTITANNVAVVEVAANAVKTSTQGQSQGSESKEKSKDNSETIIPVATTEATSIDVPQDVKPVGAHQLTTAERQAAIDIISRKIDELAAKSVRNEVRVEMHPPELGSVVINIRKDMAGISATLNASNEPLRQALHESRNDLAGALADRNVGQVRIEVRGASSDTMNMGQQFNQAQSQHQQEQQNQQAKTASQFTGRLNREETVDKPVRKRVITTLLDMEI